MPAPERVTFPLGVASALLDPVTETDTERLWTVVTGLGERDVMVTFGVAVTVTVFQ
jgi:hypothetical protein